ncbi:MAG: leucine--tRNA ligase [Candidatus Micrarchaeia archaeon]
MIDYNFISAKWQKAWEDAKIFQPEVNEKKQLLITAAIPYPNGPQHIGHLRTYGTADALARYKRMNGFNVLYPMGFHLTGIPLLAQANKVKSNDPVILADFRSFGIPDDTVQKMSDPLFMGQYFSKEVEEGMKLAGFSIDWRRRFTTIDKNFSKFIEWQFGILKEKGYLVQGEHPVGWCTKENNAVGMHDTKGDTEPEIEQETGILFQVNDESYSLICATYRPETIYGVTNIFINKDATYYLCDLKEFGDVLVSSATYEKLVYQLKLIKKSEIRGEELINKSCINPISKNKIPILPGYFVKQEIGTGIVMSVPAHAPFDYIALKRLFKEGIINDEIKPIKVVTLDNIKPEEIPAEFYLKKLGIDINSPNDKIEEATKLEYKEESHRGIMSFPGYEGQSEPVVREHIIDKLKGSKQAVSVYIIANRQRVLCRCGTEIIVKIIDNQWFINYGNQEWKESAKNYLEEMRIVPEKSKSAFLSAMDWINLRAVARSQGLGTKFPFDQRYIIESLSDSTIYMAYYTINTYINNVESEKLTSEFFDYIFRNIGSIDEISTKLGIPYDIIKKSKESFNYWYKNTSRHSGLDLIFNHLTMHIFNHIAVFDRAFWPKQIVVNGLVMMNGEKMSKSLGNIIIVKDAIKKYGADIIKLVEIGNTDLFNDSDFVEDTANGIKERIEYMFDLSEKLGEFPSNKLDNIDYWLYSKLNKKIQNITNAMEKLELRDIVNSVIFNTNIELRRYISRGGNNAMVLREYLCNVALMLQPLAPHVSEELWNLLGNTTLAATETWPSVDSSLIDEKIEFGEMLIDSTIDDVKQIYELTKNKIANIKNCKIIVADQWKRDSLNKLIETKNISGTISTVNESVNKEVVSKYLTGIFKRINEIRPCKLSEEEEFNIIAASKSYISKITGLEITVEKENGSASQRAARAFPQKPSIEVF